MDNQIHNIGIIAHIDAGKTTTTERLLFVTGKSYRIGEVDQGTATMDWMEQEQNRGITITSAATSIKWKNHNINIIDTPGHVDFTIEVERALKVLDGVVGVFCAVGGVEPQSETVWKQSEQYHVAKIAYINKMDRLGADFYHVLEDIKEKLHIIPIPLFIPIGKEKEFEGIIDVLEQKEILWNSQSIDLKFTIHDIRNELQTLTKKYYNFIIEQCSEVSNEVADLYLSDLQVPKELLIQSLKKGVLDHIILPVFCGASLKSIGIQPLLDGIISYLPTPDQVPLPPVHERHNGKLDAELTKWNSDTRLMIMVFKSEVHKDYGLLHYVRIYRGSLKPGSVVFDLTTGKKEKITRILRMHSHKSEQIELLSTGEIGVLVGPRFTRTGHTLSDVSHPLLLLEPLISPEPVITTSVEVQNLSDRDKLFETLEKISIEDPSFFFKEDENSGQILISGMGELHLDVITTRIKNDYKLSVRQGNPQVNYREGISIAYIETYDLSKHQSHVISEKNINIFLSLQVEPAKKGAGVEFTHSLNLPVLDDLQKNQSDASNNTSVIQSWWISDIEQAVKESASTGIILGYPIIDIKITLLELKITGELSKGDFYLKYATSQSFHNACKLANPIKLEPIMNVIISVPNDMIGDAMNTITSRRGIVHEIKQTELVDIIKAEAPLRELFGYATAIRNATQGRGSFTMKFSCFTPVND